jgi:hypothetical protein
MSFVVSGRKRFLVILFYCVRRSDRAQPGQAYRAPTGEGSPKTPRERTDLARPRHFRLCKQFRDRVIGVTLIMADSEQLDLLGELSLLR